MMSARTTLFGAAALLMTGAADAATLGFGALNRGIVDIPGTTLLVAMPALKFPEPARVTSWSIFVDTDNPGNPNVLGDDVALVILKDLGPAGMDPAGFEIVAADFRIPVAGLNSFTTSIDVEQDWFIGLFSTSTRVSWDFALTQPEFEISAVGLLSDWDMASEAVGQTLGYGGIGYRVYSLDVTYESRTPGGGGVNSIPLPAAAWLLLGGLGALGAVARRCG